MFAIPLSVVGIELDFIHLCSESKRIRQAVE